MTEPKFKVGDHVSALGEDGVIREIKQYYPENKNTYFGYLLKFDPNYEYDEGTYWERELVLIDSED